MSDDIKFPEEWLTRASGKTILTSLIVEEVGKLVPRPTVLYFYCKYEDIERNNFTSIARSLLCQLLLANKDTLLSYYYEKFSNSGEPILTSLSSIEVLLEVALLSCSDVYIVIDGVDECPRRERTKISTWFRNLVENLQPPRQGQVRCLFVSQDDSLARKDFVDITTIKVEKSHTRSDIEKYSQLSISQFPTDMSEILKERIAVKIQKAADGML